MDDTNEDMDILSICQGCGYAWLVHNEEYRGKQIDECPECPEVEEDTE